MFLIDSSAWIEYLRPNGSKRVKERVREILEKDDAVSCGIVISEGGGPFSSTMKGLSCRGK